MSLLTICLLSCHLRVSIGALLQCEVFIVMSEFNVYCIFLALRELIVALKNYPVI
jgi:hypothetical protein